MIKVIAVSGTPGTGKTTIAKKVARIFRLKYIDVNDIVKKYSLSEGYDKKKKCKIIDVKRMEKAIVKEISDEKKERGFVVDSHLSHHMSKKILYLCVVTKCDLKVLKRRLGKRKYSKSKIRENLDCEIFDICYNEALEKGHKVIAVDTTKKVDEKRLKRMIKPSTP